VDLLFFVELGFLEEPVDVENGSARFKATTG
jgi:hypothetical protein